MFLIVFQFLFLWQSNDRKKKQVSLRKLMSLYFISAFFIYTHYLLLPYICFIFTARFVLN